MTRVSAVVSIHGNLRRLAKPHIFQLRLLKVGCDPDVPAIKRNDRHQLLARREVLTRLTRSLADHACTGDSAPPARVAPLPARSPPTPPGRGHSANDLKAQDDVNRYRPLTMKAEIAQKQYTPSITQARARLEQANSQLKSVLTGPQQVSIHPHRRLVEILDRTSARSRC